MNIVWNSVAPWVPSGYGQQTAQVTTRLRDAGHDVAIAAFIGIEGRMASWEGMTVFPQDHTRFNKWALRKYVERHSANGTGDDVQVITLQDVHVWLDKGYQAGGMRADWDGLNIAAWCPVEHYPCPMNTLQPLEAFNARPIAMSRFGEEALREKGLNPLYVPHAIDTSVFCSRDPALVRQQWGLDADAFVVGVVGYNQGIAPSRKAFPEIFHAFGLFLKDHPDAVLYLHTDVLGLSQGLNLVPMIEEYGIPVGNVRNVDQDKYQTFCEITPEAMSYMYSALDVLLMPSYGEGFGIPLIEAQASGTPVITTDWTAMTELVGPGWLVDGEPYRNAGSASQWMKPAISEILDRLELAYASRGDQRIAEECRRFALQYDADSVFEDYWVPALAALEAPREVGPLPQVRKGKRKVAA